MKRILICTYLICLFLLCSVSDVHCTYLTPEMLGKFATVFYTHEYIKEMGIILEDSGQIDETDEAIILRGSREGKIVTDKAVLVIPKKNIIDIFVWE